MPETPPFRFRDYDVASVIAKGGMATVYLATDSRNGRKVALKQILGQMAEDQEFLERFGHEVRIHASLHHPNILELFDFEAGPVDYFIAMELVDGGSLRFLLDRIPDFPIEAALFVAAETLRGLAAAHASGIVHRDVKPHNILVTRAGDVKVADFGISKTSTMTKLTQTGELIGTPAYMSPEQALGQKLDVRSDVFSTGVVLYELLTGVNPFHTGNPATTLKRIVDHEPEPLFEVDSRLPVECELLLERLLAKHPDDRIATAAAAASAIDERIRALGISTPKAAFRQFLVTPQSYLRDRRTAAAKAHLERAKALLSSGVASPEVTLWEAFQAFKNDSGQMEASDLVRRLATEASYAIEGAEPSSRARELERKLATDRFNVSLLLQTAKLFKVERNFPKLMRYFFRLRSLPIDDAYLAGQVVALVARPGSAGAAAALDVSAPPPSPLARPIPEVSGARAGETGGTSSPRPTAASPTLEPPLAAPAPRPLAASPAPAPRPSLANSVPRPTAAPNSARPSVSVRPPAAAGPTAFSTPKPPAPLSEIPLPFKIGFGIAALLVLAGVARMLFS